MKGNKYRHLNGGVQSFTEGFTGIINAGFAHLGRYAREHGIPAYHFDIRNRTSTPDMSGQEPWAEWLMTYIDLPAWCEGIGCTINHIKSFTISVSFDLTQYHEGNGEDWMPFSAHTMIVDDQAKKYAHNHLGVVWIPLVP